MRGKRDPVVSNLRLLKIERPRGLAHPLFCDLAFLSHIAFSYLYVALFLSGSLAGESAFRFFIARLCCS